MNPMLLPYLSTLDSHQSELARWGASLVTKDPAQIQAVDPSIFANSVAAQNGREPNESDTMTALGHTSTPSLSNNPVYGGRSPSTSSAQLDYYLADIAKHYGMNKATAYQEALSNSSYQRAVADLRAAGLNPVLALGKVTGADSFAGSAASSGGSGAGSGRSQRQTDWSKTIGEVAKIATSAASIIRVIGALA